MVNISQQILDLYGWNKNDFISDIDVIKKEDQVLYSKLQEAKSKWDNQTFYDLLSQNKATKTATIQSNTPKEQRQTTISATTSPTDITTKKVSATTVWTVWWKSGTGTTWWQETQTSQKPIWPISPVETQTTTITPTETKLTWTAWQLQENISEEQQAISTELWKLDEWLQQIKRDETLYKDKVTNYDEVQNDLTTFYDLIDKWIIDTKELASQLWWSEEKVNDYKNKNYSKYYTFREDIQQDITAEYEQELLNLETQKRRAEEDITSWLVRAEDDYNQQIENMKQLVEMNNQNMAEYASITWANYSSKWLELMQYYTEQWQQDINNLITAKNRVIMDLQRQMQRTIEDYSTANTQINDAMSKWLEQAKNNFTLKLEEIQTKYWTFSDETLDKIKDIQKEYQQERNDIMDRASEQTKNLFEMQKQYIDTTITYNDKLIKQREDYVKNITDSGEINTMNIQSIYDMYQNDKISGDQAKWMVRQMAYNVSEVLNTMKWYEWQNVWYIYSQQIMEWLKAKKTPIQIVKDIVSQPDVQKLKKVDTEKPITQVVWRDLYKYNPETNNYELIVTGKITPSEELAMQRLNFDKMKYEEEKTWNKYQWYDLIETDKKLSRTDRNFNPIAISNAKQEWLDTLNNNWIQFWLEDWADFSWLKTISFPSEYEWIQASKILLWNTSAFYWYKNKTWKDVFDRFDIQTQEDFKNLSDQQQVEVIKWIYNTENKWGKTNDMFQETWVSEDQIKYEDSLRAEYNNLPEIKNFKVIKQFKSSLEEWYKLNSGAGDIAMIFSYMKMLDPTSVVRESEQSLIENAAWYPSYVQWWIKQLTWTWKLSEQARNEILEAWNQFYLSQEKWLEPVNIKYTDIAIDRWARPYMIINSNKSQEDLDFDDYINSTTKNNNNNINTNAIDDWSGFK